MLISEIEAELAANKKKYGDVDVDVFMEGSYTRHEIQSVQICPGRCHLLMSVVKKR